MVRTLDELDVTNKTVLVQSNLDVPFSEETITDDTRLIASLETIQELLSKGCRVILCGHIGRPKGEYVASLSTKKLISKLQELLKQQITFLPIIDKDLVEKVPKPGVGMLENIRMWSGEEANDEAFAKQLASLADAYVNDDYIDSHRETSANTLLPTLLPSAMGRTLYKEYSLITNTITNPKRPYVAIIGGAKKDKLRVIEHVLRQADHILLGGVLANTFLKATGQNIASSKYDKESQQEAQELYKHTHKILLPSDCVAAKKLALGEETITCYLEDLPEEYMILDIGPQTIKRYKQILTEAQTVVWGGPIGAFETAPFEHGTEEIARTIANTPGYSLIAGGDSAAAIHKLRLNVDHISIGGGATLHLIAGDALPAIEALKK
ncbi:MAG: phosphoglycerate kinase [Candidatus Woesearchaeota archaeon]